MRNLIVGVGKATVQGDDRFWNGSPGGEGKKVGRGGPVEGEPTWVDDLDRASGVWG